jgi:hypothetical protein
MTSDFFPSPDNADDKTIVYGQEFDTGEDKAVSEPGSQLTVLPPITETLPVAEGVTEDSIRAAAEVPLSSVKRNIRKHHEESRKSCNVAIVHAVEAGRWLNEAKKRLPRGKFLDWLKENFSGEHGGPSVRTCQRYMKVADGYPQLAEATAKGNPKALIADAQNLLAGVSVRKALGMIQEAESGTTESPSSQRPRRSQAHVARTTQPANVDLDEALTPQSIIEAVSALLGEIDLDPCAESAEQHNVPAKNYYTADDNGLAPDRPWSGRLFIHPPLDSAEQWIDRTLRELTAGTIREAVLLLPTRTDATWLRSLRGFAIAFMSERLQVRLPGQEQPQAMPEPMMLVFVGHQQRIGDFADACQSIAEVFIPYVGQ